MHGLGFRVLVHLGFGALGLGFRLGTTYPSLQRLATIYNIVIYSPE